MRYIKSYMVLTLLLLMVGVGKTYATEYVFKTSDGQYVCIDSEGNLGVTSTFDHTTCIWSGTSGSGKFTCNGKSLGCTQNGSVYTPTAGGTKYTTITINTSNSINYVTYNKTSYYKYNSTDASLRGKKISVR